MVRRLESSEVFQPTSFPDHTYVNRLMNGRETYEARLQKALKTKGVLTLITGPSKSGKTVLCHSVISSDKLIEISGSHIRTSDDFWLQITEKLQFPIETETTLQELSETTFVGEAGGKGGIPLVVDVHSKFGASHKTGDTESTKEKYQLSRNELISNLIQYQTVLVIDDFHYIQPDVQKYIARILKSGIFHGLKAVVVSLPHRSDDARRMNPDLIGRVRFINIDVWSKEELREIPKKGFNILGVEIEDAFLDLLVQESITSPQLMQQNCLNLSYVLGIDQDPSTNKVDKANYIHEAFVETTRDYENYDSVIKKLLIGPSQGRQKRTQYALRNGEKLDIYHVILHSLAKDPPSVIIDMEDLQQRIKETLDVIERIPNSLTISNTLSQAQKILHESGEMFQIMEWREQQLHILDPFFLFYLRWNER